MQKKLPIHSVNLLFLIVLCLQASNFLLLWMPQFVRMILNEALFVLLPALIYLKLARLPARETLRLRWPGWRVAWASLLIGAGLYPLGIISIEIYQSLLGYQLFGTERLLPHNALEGALAIIAYAVMAPLCEEILSRGVIQRAYESLGPRRAILYAGGLFVIFHLSLLQGLGIIPLALALGFVYWRSQSLVASILTHFGANAMASLVITGGVFWQNASAVLLSTPALIIGMALAAVGVWRITRLTHPGPAEPLHTERSWLQRAWPLLLAGLLYSGVVGLEVASARAPERFLAPVTLNPSPWDKPAQWHYEIRNIVDDPVGKAQCELTPGTDDVALTCHSTHQAYDVDTGQGRYIGGDGEIILSGHWRRTDGAPVQGETVQRFQGQSRTGWTFDGTQFSITQQDNDEAKKTFDFPLNTEGQTTPFVLAKRSWPWALSALPFEKDYAANAHIFNAYTWREQTQDSGPQTRLVVVRVTGIEEVTTPAGTFSTWGVQVGERETAWYTVDEPHIVVKYFDGIEMWLLDEQ